METPQLSRRTFLTGAGLVAAAGLAGCAPQTKTLSSTGATGASADLPETWDMEADVVVIGSGAAGAATAWWT